jgi:uncharacterized membrane protein
MAKGFGKNLSVFTVNTQTIVAYIASATINHQVSTFESTCLTDGATYNQTNRDDYTISFSMVYDNAATPTGYLQNLIDAVGDEVAFTITTVSGGQTYASTGLLRSASHQLPDGGQQVDFEIIPAGVALTT